MPTYVYQGQEYEIQTNDPLLAKQKILAYLAKQQPPSKERTYGEALQDIGAGVVGGIGSLVQLPGQLYGLATGDMSRTGALGVGKDIEEYAETLKSAGLKAREEARRKAIEEATAKEGQFGAFKSAFSETVKDPALLLTFLAEQAPQLLVPFGAAKIAKGATAARGAGEVAAAQAGVRGAVGAAGVQQGADVGAGAYENIYAELKSKGASDREAAEGALNLARAAGASGAIISVLAQRLPGAKALEETFAGVPGTAGRAARVSRGALGESAGEITEEVGGRFGQNLAMREVKPEQSLTEGLGETAGMAAIGGGLLGGVAGLARRPQPPAEPVVEPPPPPPTPEQQRIEQLTGVQRPPAVGIEGLLSAQEAARQEAERAPLQPGQARATLPEFERGVTSLLRPGETRAEPLPEFLTSKYGLRPGESRVVGEMPSFEAPATAEVRQVQEDIAAREKIARDAEAKRVREVQTVPGEARSATDEMLEIIRRIQIADLPNSPEPLTTEQRNYLRNRLIELQQQAKPQPRVGPESRPEVKTEGALGQLPTETKPEVLAQRQAEVEKRRAEAGFPTAEQRREGIRVVEKPKAAPRSPLPRLADPRPMTQEQANARLGVMRSMLTNEGGDPNSLGIVPHPSASGKFAIKSFDLPFKLSLETQATAFGTPEKPVVIDPVEAYVNIARQTNTPAAKRFVKDWEAGRIPREDVERALQTERQLLSLPPLTFLGSPEAKIAQQQIPGPTVQGVRDISDKPIRNVGLVAEGPASTFPPAKFNVFQWSVPRGVVQNGIELPSISFFNNTNVDPVEYYIQNLTDQTNIDPATLDTQEEKDDYNKVKSFLDAYKQNQIPRSSIEKALKRSDRPLPPPVTPPAEPNVPPDESVLSIQEFKKRLPSNVKSAELEKLVNKANLSQVIDYFKKHQNPFFVRVAELMEPIKKEVVLTKPRRIAGAAGQYNYREDKITMHKDYAGDEVTMIHEMVHALVARSQIWPTPKQKKFVQEIKKLRDYTEKELKKKGRLIDPNTRDKWYGLNVDLDPRGLGLEFVTEAMSYPEFQYELMQIPYTKTQSVWTKFVDAVATLLGIKQKNALSEIMSLVESLAQTPRPKPVGTARRMEESVLSKSIKETAEQIKEKARQAQQKRSPLKLAPQVSAEAAEKFQQTFAPENKTIIDKIEGLKDRFWQRMSQGIADQFRSIKEYDEKAYMQARLSKSVDGGLEGLLFYGEVYNDDGALNIRKDGKGLIKVLEPVGTEVDNFMIWVALNREEQLQREGKIPSIPEDLIAEKNNLSSGTLNGQPRLQVYKRVLEDMNKLNRSVLKIALDTGLIDQNGYDKFSSDIYYVPFYKEMEGKDIDAPSTASGLTSQYFSKQLKGGERPFGDLVENTLRNWNHILSAAMKNQAAVSTIQSASRFRLGDTPVVEPTTEKTGSAKIMVDGQAQYFKINDPLLFEAISAIGYLGPKSKFLDVARDFKNILQFGVTLSPAFKVNNLIRDSVSAMAVTELNKNPITNVLNGVSIFNKNDPTYISALAGGAIFNFGTAYEGDQSKLIKRLIEKGINRDTILDTPDRIRKGLRMAWDKYQDWGNASEAANRLALYKQLRDKGMSHLEATYQARDLLDFSMQGSWPAFRLVTQVVPFMNARIQGLYKLGRDGVIPTSRVLYNVATGKEIEGTDKQKAEAFGLVTGAVMLASMALYLTFKDDEEYQKRDEWDRDNFWWFKLPGMDVALRVPKPFEIGAFGTLTERILEQVVDEGAEGKQFTDALKRMVGDTFALNPTPQMFKPLIDLYANKDSFTGAPIESAGLERLSKQERINDNTSPLAIALGGISKAVAAISLEKAELSPVQIDYAIKGYFGWLGGLASTISTYAVMPFREGAYPDTKWIDRASLGLARDLPSNQARYVTAFYENGKEINQAYADMRHYAEVGDAEKVEKILEEKGDKIALAKFYDKTAKNMSEIRKQIRVIMADTTMDGAAKREEIDRMKMIIAELAKQAEEARKQFR
jgi:Large polyvalent protein associated domain 38